MTDVPFLPDYPATLPNVIADTTRRYADREFLVMGERRLTFRDVERSSAHLARGLLAAGVGKATRVGIIIPNTPDWVEAWYAAGRIGAFTVPLSTFFQAREISWALNEADIDTLLIVDEYLGHNYIERLERAIPELASQTSTQLYLPSHPYLRRIVVWGQCDRPWAIKGPQALRAMADAVPTIDDAYLKTVESLVTPADLLMGICTSGSTAQPKIVVHTHGSVLKTTHAYRSYSLGNFRPDERCLCAMPFFWLGGLNSNLMPVIYEGACLLFSESQRAEDQLDVLIKEKATRASMWPAQFKPIREVAEARGLNLNHLVPGVEVRDPAGNILPLERRIASLLGMTESFGPHGVGNWGEVLEEKNGASWGRNLEGIERKIVDPTTGETLPPGKDGELYIRGWSMMAGYYKRERGEIFDADGWFPTGDTCHINENGYLYFKGRVSDMIKTAGANVSPQEVELLMVTYPGVAEAIVLGMPDDVRGENVLAVVIPRDGAKIDSAAMQKRMKDEISSYKIPKEFVVMNFSDVPRTTSGKVQRNALKKLLAERQPAAK
jgi:acyl-coenzyme A synthetase/AMP-(fatty) acid ligase